MAAEAFSVWGQSKQPDGTPRKLMDSRRLKALGWRPTITLEQGLAQAYADFLKHHAAPAHPA